MPGGLIADVFDTIGAKTVFLTGDLVYHTLQSGAIDAADFSGPATNFNLGLADVAKYIIMGPPSTPCIHQPVDLHCALVGLEQWSALPNHLQQVLEYATRRFSWDDYACVQRKNLQAWEGFREKGTEIIRLSTSDIDRLRNAAIPIWFKWGRKDPLAAEALASQIAYMKSPAIGYLNDAMLVDKRGERLSL
jgi:TRAP-type mannitol/chloroaromatic compound transport system substrate-binding protein